MDAEAAVKHKFLEDPLCTCTSHYPGELGIDYRAGSP